MGTVNWSTVCKNGAILENLEAAVPKFGFFSS